MSKPITIEIKINNYVYHEAIDYDQTLLNLIREQLNLTGTKEGCNKGQCGACTVIKDGVAVNACLTLAIQCNGSAITTIEGLAESNELDPLQLAFVKEGAIQCGFCTPGMIMSAKALLKEIKNPDTEQIKEALSGNLCRCSGYTKVMRAIESTIKEDDI